MTTSPTTRHRTIRTLQVPHGSRLLEPRQGHAGARGTTDDGIGEHDVGEPDPEVGDDDTAGGWPGRPGEDRLTDRRGRVRVAVELPGVAVGDELPALVDEEQGGVTGDVGGAHRRVVDRDDEGRWRAASRRS